MNTKIIVVGQTTPKDLIPIKFKFNLDKGVDYVNFSDTGMTPSQFKYIELICKNYGNGFDLMFAYDDPSKREKGVLFAGYFNDGVVVN